MLETIRSGRRISRRRRRRSEGEKAHDHGIHHMTPRPVPQGDRGWGLRREPGRTPGRGSLHHFAEPAAQLRVETESLPRFRLWPPRRGGSSTRDHSRVRPVAAACRHGRAPRSRHDLRHPSGPRRRHRAAGRGLRHDLCQGQRAEAAAIRQLSHPSLLDRRPEPSDRRGPHRAVRQGEAGRLCSIVESIARAITSRSSSTVRKSAGSRCPICCRETGVLGCSRMGASSGRSRAFAAIGRLSRRPFGLSRRREGGYDSRSKYPAERMESTRPGRIP